MPTYQMFDWPLPGDVRWVKTSRLYPDAPVEHPGVHVVQDDDEFIYLMSNSRKTLLAQNSKNARYMYIDPKESGCRKGLGLDFADENMPQRLLLGENGRCSARLSPSRMAEIKRRWQMVNRDPWPASYE